jgi:hypothetical protein
VFLQGRWAKENLAAYCTRIVVFRLWVGVGHGMLMQLIYSSHCLFAVAAHILPVRLTDVPPQHVPLQYVDSRKQLVAEITDQSLNPLTLLIFTELVEFQVDVSTEVLAARFTATIIHSHAKQTPKLYTLFTCFVNFLGRVTVSIVSIAA